MIPSSVRVLIVDDEPISRKMVQFALEQKGFECDLAEDGQAAQQKLAERPYHVVVTDLLMPGIHGFDLVISLCARMSRPIVVVHTSVLELEVSQCLKSEGVDDIIFKPANHDELADKIQRLVESQWLRPMGKARQKQRCQPSAFAEPRQAIRLLGLTDDWIQSRPYRMEVFRFGIVLLACILFGLGWGNSLAPSVAGDCRMFALCGLAFYFCLQLVAYHRDQSRATLSKYAAERRLSLVTTSLS